MSLINATKEIRSAKRSVEKIAFNITNDPKTFYRYARKKIKIKDSVGPVINDSGDVIGDSRCVAFMLNKYFMSAFSAEDTNYLPIIDASTYRDKELPRLLFTRS